MSSTTHFELKAYLAAEVERVDQALRRALEAMDTLDPPETAAVGHGVLSGGKRLRPILCVAAYRALADTADADEGAVDGGDVDPAAYDLAVSLELIHAYSLMHDDLPSMDDADLRRGRPTTHREHGEEVTMAAGAALIPLAALQALRSSGALGVDADVARGIAGQLMEASGAGGMVGGQWLDLQGEGERLDARQLGELHGRKTGALLAASLVMGAMAAGATPEERAAFQEYGRAIGLAFQIADDILDATSSAEELGKNPSDAELDKSTYVALHGLDEAGLEARRLVDSALASLSDAGIRSAPLEALARYVVERER